MKRMKETIGRLAAGSLRWAALAIAIGLAGSAWATVTKKAEWVGNFPVSNGSVVTDTKGDITLSTYDAVNVSTARGITLNGKSITLTPKTALSGGVTVVMGYKGATSSTTGTLINLSKTVGSYGTAISANMKGNYGFSLGWGTNYTWGDSNSATISATQPNDGDIHYVTLSYAGNTSTGTIFSFDGANKVQKTGLGSSSFGTVAEITLGGLCDANALSGVEIVYIAVYSGVVTDDEATSTCNAGKTAFAAGSMNPTVDDSNNATFTVTDDAYYYVSSDATYNSITFNVTAGKTLELFGAASLTGTNGIAVNGGNVKLAKSNQIKGELAGNGTIVYKGAVPSNVTYSSSWDGTVWIKELQGNAARNFDAYGQGTSKVKISGITGYLDSNPTITFSRELVLDDDTYGFAMKLGNGNSPGNTDANKNRCAIFKKLSGDGTFTAGGSTGGNGAYSWPVIRIIDSSEFTGTINCQVESGAQLGGVIFSDEDEEMPDSMWNMFSPNTQRIFVSAGRKAATGNAVTVPVGKTWVAQGGIDVRGDLIVNGTLNAAIVNNTGSITVNPGAAVPNQGSKRDFTGWTVADGASVSITQTAEEYGKGSISVTGVASIPAITVLDPTGATIGTITPAGESTATLDTGVKISGAATMYDATFTNTTAFAYRKPTVGAIGLDTALDPKYNNTLNDATTGLYLRHHPYVDGAGSVFRALGDFTVVVVGQMSPTHKTQFIHMGSTLSGGNGLLIATTENDDEVIIAPNTNGKTVQTGEGKSVTVSVPNAASARHAYVIKKSGTTFTVWADGIKRGNFTVDSSFQLGNSSNHCGVQVGSDFGGEIQRDDSDPDRYKAVANSLDETGVVNVIRIFDYVISDEQAEAIVAAYPYVSAGGLYTRTLTADADLSETDAWDKDGTATTYALPEGATEDNVFYHPSATITSSADATLTVNADLTIDTLTVDGGNTLSVVSDGTHSVGVSGAAVVNSPLAITYGALRLAGTPVQLGSGGTLSFDCSGIDLSSVYETTTYQLTGLMDQDNSKVTATLPTAPAGRAVALNYNANGFYEVIVTVDHTAGSDVYYTGGYWGNNPSEPFTVVNESGDATTVFPGDTVVIDGTHFSGSSAYFASTLPDNVAEIRVDKDLTFEPGVDTAILGGKTVTVSDNCTLSFAETWHQLTLGAVTFDGPGAVSVPVDITVSGAVSGTAPITVASGKTVTVDSTGSIANTITLSSGAALVAPAASDAYTFDPAAVVDSAYTAGGVKYIPYTDVAASVTQNGTTLYYSDLTAALTPLAKPENVSEDVTLVLLNGTTLPAAYVGQMQGMGYYINGDTITKAVAMITTTPYATLADAVAAAADGATIVLKRNSSEAISLTKAITLTETASYTGELSGTGTLTLTALRSTALSFGEWTGTVVLPANQTFAGTKFNDYGVEGSVVRLQGDNTGWFDYNFDEYWHHAEPVATTVDIPAGASLTITGFSPSYANTFNVLTGAGAFAFSVTADPNNDLANVATWSGDGYSWWSAYFLLKDVSGFTGSLSTSADVGIAIGSAKPALNTAGGQILLTSADAELTVADGETVSPAPTTTVEGSYVETDDLVIGFTTYFVEPFKTVTFVDEDGTTVKDQQTGLHRGDAVVYGGTEPQKAATAQYTYTFTGWDDGTTQYGPTDALPDVTGDATYTATYDSTVNQYTLTVPEVANATATVTVNDVEQSGVAGEGETVYTFDYGTAAVVTYTADTYYSVTANGTQNFTLTGNDDAVAPTVARNTVTVTLPIVTGAYVTAATSDAGDVTPTGPNTLSAPAGSTLTLTWAASEGYIIANTTTTFDVGSEAVTVSGDGLAQPSVIVARFYASADATDSTPYAALLDGYTGALVALAQALMMDSTSTAYVEVVDPELTTPNEYATSGIGYSETDRKYARAVTKIGNGDAAYLNLADAWTAAGTGTDTATITVLSDPSDSVTVAAGQTLKVAPATGVDLSDNVSFAEGIKTSTTTEEGVTTYTARNWYSWTVTVVAENATVTGITSPVSEANPTINFTVTPDTYYSVATVTANGTELTPVSGTYTYTLTGNVTVSATATRDQVTLTVPEVENASAVVTVDDVQQEVAASYTINKGANVVVTWTAAATYKITAGATQTIDPITETQTAATPTVERDTVTVTVPGVTGTTVAVTASAGDVTDNGDGTYTVQAGATVTVTWTNDGAYVITNGSTSFTADGDVTVSNLPTAVPAVAEVGGAYYATLAEAVAAVEDGGTVTLLANVSATAQVVVSKAITLDGGNHTLTTTADWAINVHNVDNATVTIKDLTVTPGSATERFVSVEECANLTLNITGCDMQGCTYYAVNVRGSNTGLALNIDDTTLSGYCALNFWGDSGTVTVTDSTLVGVNNSPYSLNNNEFGVIVCNKYNANQPGYAISVSNTTLRAVSNIVTQGKRNDQYILLYNPDTKGNTIRLTDCTVEHGEGDAATYAFIHEEPGTSGNTTYLKNVTLAGEAVELPEGYAYSAPDADGYRQVVSAVAAVNGTGYATLAEAVAQTTSGTITLLSDCEGEGIFVGENAGKDITIDFGDHTYTVVLPVGSSTTINQMLHFEAGNTITLTNGMIKVTDDSEKLAAFQMVMQNYCNLTIDGMEIDGTGIAIAKYPTFSGKWAVFSNTDKPQFNYNGFGVSVIRNSTIIVPGDISIDEDAGLAISGNTVINANGIATKGTDERFASVNPVVEISGGTFSFSVPAVCCAAGYEPKDNGDGTYGVQTAKVEVETDEDDPTPTTAEPVTVLVAVPKACAADELIDTANRAEGDVLKAYVKADDCFYTWELKSGAWEPKETYKVYDESSATVSTKPAAEVNLTAGQSVWVTITTEEAIKLLVTYNETPVAVEVEAGWNMVAPTTPGGTKVSDIIETLGDAITEKDAIVIPASGNGGAPKIYNKVNGEWGYDDIEYEERTIKGQKVKVAKPFRNTTDTTIKAGRGVWFVNGGDTEKNIDL